jgi:SP family general alpha glucoside:H+ symporter-like MFS transporter
MGYHRLNDFVSLAPAGRHLLFRLVILGLLTIPANSGNAAAKWVQACMMLLWVLVFQFSVGPLAYCIVGEV